MNCLRSALTVLVVTLALPVCTQAAVEPSNDAWVLRGKRVTVTLSRKDLSFTAQCGGAAWRAGGAAEGDLTFEVKGARFPLALTNAARVEFKPVKTGYAEGVQIELAGFRHDGKDLDATLKLSIVLERESEELVFEAIPAEGQARIKELLWPRGFKTGAADKTVVPFMQGMLLPGDWPHQVTLYDPIAYGRGLYMPWWGQQQGESAVMVILETPDDGACRFEHPAGGPTAIGPRWLHSLGRLQYPRRLRLCCFEQGNYVDMARRYRQHVADAGNLVTLKEKIARAPLASKLLGAPVVHTSILSHIEPESSYYNPTNPAANHQLVSFDQRARELRKLYQSGVKHAYVHLDGWGLRGYDNLHPDLLPPSPEAGGWDGMRRFADTCEELGYVFAVHDNYRDFYHDAKSYSEALTVIEENGSRPFMKIWWGGRQSLLCSKFAPGYVARNHGQILAHGIKLRGAYLDVFSVVPGDECYSPDHAVTRGESLRWRGQCFEIIRNLEGIVSSEEPADWAMRHLHLVHHAPFALDPNPGKGPAIGIPVPLHALVYHDVLVVPWSLSKGGWGIPDEDLGFLHALLCAGVPYASLTPDAAHLEQLRTVCALHRRLALVPMTRHEFVEGNYRRQKTTFADGTVVEADFETGKHSIAPPLTPAELSVLE